MFGRKHPKVHTVALPPPDPVLEAAREHLADLVRDSVQKLDEMRERARRHLEAIKASP